MDTPIWRGKRNKLNEIINLGKLFEIKRTPGSQSCLLYVIRKFPISYKLHCVFEKKIVGNRQILVGIVPKLQILKLFLINVNADKAK